MTQKEILGRFSSEELRNPVTNDSVRERIQNEISPREEGQKTLMELVANLENRIQDFEDAIEFSRTQVKNPNFQRAEFLS